MHARMLAIDETQCTGCGECERECLLSFERPMRERVDHADPNCEGCLHCYAVCPSGAIELSDGLLPFEDSASAENPVTADALERLFAGRRSTRRFEDRALPPDTLERIVQAGRYIPSGGNRHAHEFTVILDDATKARLLSEFRAFYRRLRSIMR